jgi:hypothetical protein
MHLGHLLHLTVLTNSLEGHYGSAWYSPVREQKLQIIDISTI